MITRMERLGCDESIVGLVIPTGYAFNLDGTCIYLTMATLFLAQATNVHLSLAQQLGILGVLLLTSNGAAAVTGSEFIVPLLGNRLRRDDVAGLSRTLARPRRCADNSIRCRLKARRAHGRSAAMLSDLHFCRAGKDGRVHVRRDTRARSLVPRVRRAPREESAG